MKNHDLLRTSLALLAGMLLGTAQAQSPYPSAEQAADALIKAIIAKDQAGYARVLGADWKRLLPPGGVSAEDRQAFLDLAAQATKVNVIKDGRAALSVGATDPYTLPIPIAQGKDGQWRFDIKGGREAMLDRRIGLNERSAMQAALAYVDAQREYALADRNGDGMLEYAQKFVSSPGKRDGLIWPQSLGDESPMGEDLVPTKPGEGYHGYHFKILQGQGPAAASGERSYLIGKRMSSGYALLAWPVQYGKTGVMSFIVNQDGQLFERDLGPATAQAAAGIRRFNPDEGWAKTKP